MIKTKWCNIVLLSIMLQNTVNFLLFSFFFFFCHVRPGLLIPFYIVFSIPINLNFSYPLPCILCILYLIFYYIIPFILYPLSYILYFHYHEFSLSNTLYFLFPLPCIFSFLSFVYSLFFTLYFLFPLPYIFSFHYHVFSLPITLYFRCFFSYVFILFFRRISWIRGGRGKIRLDVLCMLDTCYQHCLSLYSVVKDNVDNMYSTCYQHCLSLCLV